MNNFDYSLDVSMDDGYDDGYNDGYNDDYNDDFDGDLYEWDNQRPMPPFPPRRPPMGMGYMNSQYSEAFGDYRGGYGPHGGFGPPRPRPYPLMSLRGLGHGFGPVGQPPRRGPPMHRGAMFLSKCGVADHYIKGLPRKLLDLIQPEFCGLCSKNLESFAVAKVHYNSKIHYKAQKKYLNTHKQTKNHEVPMKARNLYCELCDVHITSTAHADSHYSGKSHRSIVEHRKPAKNPALHQPSMSGRVEQLIRREKKHMKAVQEAAEKETTDTPAADEAAAADPEKKIPPELICVICKTTVTCSEQMTNHLNGKKHLTKEKQHILNMMKGENEDDVTDIKEENVGGDNVDDDAVQDEAALELGAKVVGDDGGAGNGVGDAGSGVGDAGNGVGDAGSGVGDAGNGVGDAGKGAGDCDWGAGGGDWDAQHMD